MLKSLMTIIATALVADALATNRHNKTLKARQDQKPKIATVRKNDDEIKLWHLSRASSRLAHREWKGDYIGVPAEQKIMDLDFELIVARF